MKKNVDFFWKFACLITLIHLPWECSENYPLNFCYLKTRADFFWNSESRKTNLIELLPFSRSLFDVRNRFWFFLFLYLSNLCQTQYANRMFINCWDEAKDKSDKPKITPSPKFKKKIPPSNFKRISIWLNECSKSLYLKDQSLM